MWRWNFCMVHPYVMRVQHCCISRFDFRPLHFYHLPNLQLFAWRRRRTVSRSGYSERFLPSSSTAIVDNCGDRTSRCRDFHLPVRADNEAIHSCHLVWERDARRQRCCEKLFTSFFSNTNIGVHCIKDMGLLGSRMLCCKYGSQMSWCVGANRKDVLDGDVGRSHLLLHALLLPQSDIMVSAE
jgi:hypothetical protein